MKNFTFRLTIAGIFLIMLFQPSKVFEGASSGLLLWFQIVLPTLLPFIFISGILVKSNAVSLLTNLTGPLLSRFFKVSKTGTYPVATGFLCGYPMGAKAVSDLAFNGLIANKEARYLLSFCNNTSPAFIMNFLVLQNLKKEALMLPSLFILLIAPVCASFIFRFFYKESNASTFVPSEKSSALKGLSLIDESIIDSFEAVTKVGGYIMVFSILLVFAKELFPGSFLWQYLFLPALEVTNGIVLLCNSDLAFPLKYTLLMACTSFGGLCAAAQTDCMLQGTDIPLLPYIAEKLVTTGITSFIAYCYINFIF